MVNSLRFNLLKNASILSILALSDQSLNSAIHSPLVSGQHFTKSAEPAMINASKEP